jgi:N-acetylmuramate 1-kinase
VSEIYKEVRRMVEQLVLGDEEVSNWVKRSKVIDSVTKLPGDASTRRYYRVASRGQTFIVQRMEPFTEKGEDIPFVVVQKHLAASGVEVPAILDIDPERGFVLLEDLGDVTLLQKLRDVSSADVERHMYERVIDGLIHLQIHASPARRPADIDAYKLRFDYAKLMWEMDFAIEHFYQLHLKREIPEADLKAMRDGLGEICRFLAEQPTVLTHRDFHSRNIMITEAPRTEGAQPAERLVMIDFQDARMGPAQYDLASLLRDSYYQLEEAQIQRLVDYYVIRWEALAGETLDRAHFMYVFDMMSVQRNFKAIGSFASFLNRRGNATYLKYIGNTFENIRRTLLKYPQYSRLRETLFHYYYF